MHGNQASSWSYKVGAKRVSLHFLFYMHYEKTNINDTIFMNALSWPGMKSIEIKKQENNKNLALKIAIFSVIDQSKILVENLKKLNNNKVYWKSLK